jgi:hypothetical protein
MWPHDRNIHSGFGGLYSIQTIFPIVLLHAGISQPLYYLAADCRIWVRYPAGAGDLFPQPPRPTVRPIRPPIQLFPQR